MSETYKAIEVRKPGEFAELRRPLQDPGHGQVRIRVEACGVCHSDAATVEEVSLALLIRVFPATGRAFAHAHGGTHLSGDMSVGLIG